jgi:hypothetical protein
MVNRCSSYSGKGQILILQTKNHLEMLTMIKNSKVKRSMLK